MKVAESINAPQYQHILINVLDRLMDFYIILYAARKNNNEMLPTLIGFRNNTKDFLIKAGFTAQVLIDLNAVDECLDILQVNYSYCRVNPQQFIKANPVNHSVYQELSKAIYEINSGNYVELTENGFIIHDGTIEEQSIVKNLMASLRKDYPCLHLLRMVDVVNAPSLENIIPLIDCAIQSYRKLNGIAQNNFSDNENGIVDMAMKNMTDLVSFYPERLYPGLRYVFPQYSGPQDYNSLALSFSHTTSAIDMQGALNDINFQFEKFKIYYHNYDTTFVDDMNLERLRPFVSKPVRDNEYIKQLNSIEGTFHALFAWKECILNKSPQTDAIHKAHLLFNEPRDLPIAAEDYKRKIRARLKDINVYINNKVTYMQSLS